MAVASSVACTSSSWLRTSVETLPDSVTLVSVRGELDLATSGKFRDLLTGMAGARSPNVVVDMSGVTFCDARGLGALVAAAESVEAAGGRLTLAGVRPMMGRILQITGLDRRFPVTEGKEGKEAASHARP